MKDINVEFTIQTLDYLLRFDEHVIEFNPINILEIGPLSKYPASKLAARKNSFRMTGINAR